MLPNEFADDAELGADPLATARDQFLLEEGLELLSSYRSISDPEARRAIRQMVANASAGLMREQ